MHNISVVCSCFQQWSVGHSHTYRPSSGWTRSTDARQDWCIVRAAVATQTAYKEVIWAHVKPAVSTMTIGNCLIKAGLWSRVPLARLPLTPRHRQARLLWCRGRVDWRVEWRSVVFSNKSRFYLHANDGRALVLCRYGERHFLECFRPRHRGPTSGFMVWGQLVTTRGHIWCFCRVK